MPCLHFEENLSLTELRANLPSLLHSTGMTFPTTSQALRTSTIFSKSPTHQPRFSFRLIPTPVNADVQTAFSGGFLNFVQNLDPNVKSSGPNITPRWNTWSSQQHNEMLFNVTAAGAAEIHTFETNAGLLQRCAYVFLFLLVEVAGVLIKWRRFWESVGASTAI